MDYATFTTHRLVQQRATEVAALAEQRQRMCERRGGAAGTERRGDHSPRVAAQRRVPHRLVMAVSAIALAGAVMGVAVIPTVGVQAPVAPASTPSPGGGHAVAGVALVR